VGENGAICAIGACTVSLRLPRVKVTPFPDVLESDARRQGRATSRPEQLQQTSCAELGLVNQQHEYRRDSEPPLALSG